MLEDDFILVLRHAEDGCRVSEIVPDYDPPEGRPTIGYTGFRQLGVEMLELIVGSGHRTGRGAPHWDLQARCRERVLNRDRIAHPEEPHLTYDVQMTPDTSGINTIFSVSPSSFHLPYNELIPNLEVFEQAKFFIVIGSNLPDLPGVDPHGCVRPAR
jgi:hypothetical protein